MPGTLVLVAALWVALRLVQVAAQTAIALWRTRCASRLLDQAAEIRDGARVYEAATPMAFVLGVFRPRIFASSALFEQPRAVVDAVVAHERVHVEQRDPLWRALGIALSALHLPGVGGALVERLKSAQESGADLRAAASLPGGRLQVAEALVALARCVVRPVGSLALRFADGDVRSRVMSLLESNVRHHAWLPRVLLLLAFGIVAAFVLSAPAVHHALETILGVLS
jgi:beta-lactamase regulating signal transducer with metallopeptidase domain